MDAGHRCARRKAGTGRVSRESVQQKAIRYLAEGRIRIRACLEDDGLLEADVRGLGAVYAAGRNSDGWFCDCPSRTIDCAHVIALKSVTAIEPREP